jgi:SAM-dependent methyltransferase
MNPEIFAGLRRALEDEAGAGRRLLDASCADGKSSAAYRDMGFAVTASNYDPAEFQIPDMRCLRLDLNEPWPFADGEFDVVVLQEVIEHLENIPFVFREARRILKPGGCFVFSTPNMLNWTSRLRFLGTGFYMGRKNPLRVNTPPGNAPNWHILPFHIYHWAGYHYGLRIEKVIGLRKRVHAFLLGVFLYPFTALYTYRWWVSSQKNSEQRAYNLDLWRHLFSNELLLSNTMVVKARKDTSVEKG